MKCSLKLSPYLIGDALLRNSRSRWLCLVGLVCVMAVASVPTIRMRRVDASAVTLTPQAGGLLYTVDSTGDGDLVGSSNFCDDGTGKCTLRAAIQAANLHSGDDGIDFSIPTSDPNCSGGNCTINLNKPLSDLSTNISITGPGPNKLVVRRNAPSTDLYRIFNVTTTGAVALSGLTIANGRTDSVGAGINVNTGTVDVSNCVLTNNTSIANTMGFPGGGAGGAIFNKAGTVSISNSVISGNHSVAGGGGILNNSGGTVNISQSLISFNRAGESTGTGGSFFNGGGIDNRGTLNIVNSTITGNIANVNGAGIANSGTLNMSNSTISSNSATGGTPSAGG